MIKKVNMTDGERAALAAEIMKWRGTTPLARASQRLGVPLRTMQGIEQGRGFPYPSLLRLAMAKVGALDNGN
jgi:hypothetical protein